MTSLHVHRHLVRCRAIGAAPPTPPDLAAALADLELSGPEGVWRIRRLDVRAVVGDHGGAGALERALAREVVREIDRTIADPTGSDDVRWWPDRPTYVAEWLVDAGRGRATGRWEYAELGTAAFGPDLLDLAESEPATVAAALHLLDVAELDEVAAALSASEVSALAHAISTSEAAGTSGAGGAGADDAATVARRVRELLDECRLPDEARRATLLVMVALGAGALVPARVVGLVRDVVTVALAVRRALFVERAALARALADGDWSGAVRLGGPEAVAALRGWPGVARADAVAVLTATPGPAGSAEDVDRATTALGGIFVLLPLLAELPFTAATVGWPELDGVDPGALLSLLAVLGVLGPDRTASALADPWLRLALGLPAIDPADLNAWTARLGPPELAVLADTLAPTLAWHAEGVSKDRQDPTLLQHALVAGASAEGIRDATSALLRELSYRLPGQATASAEHLRRNVLDLDAAISAEADRFVVELGKPPLALLLSLTGMNRRTFLLPSTGDRPWLLTQRS